MLESRLSRSLRSSRRSACCAVQVLGAGLTFDRSGTANKILEAKEKEREKEKRKDDKGKGKRCATSYPTQSCILNCLPEQDRHPPLKVTLIPTRAQSLTRTLALAQTRALTLGVTAARGNGRESGAGRGAGVGALRLTMTVMDRLYFLVSFALKQCTVACFSDDQMTRGG